MTKYQTGAALMERLNMRSREELLALLEQLIQRQSDIKLLIELLIELPLVATEQKQNRPGRARVSTLDPSTIESQVVSAFYNAGHGWGAASSIADELGRLLDIGNSFAEAGEWANAQVVYVTIVQATIVPYEGIHDEGEVSLVLEECASGLIECLEVQSTLLQDEQLDTEEREKILTALFELWKFGYNYGGINVDVTGAIAENTTEHERKIVETWLRQEMRQGQDFSDKWHNSRSIDFLTTLKRAGHFSDDDLLEEYRKASLHKELAQKLLQLGRENEALGVAQTMLTEPNDVTWFAEQLINLGDVWREQAMGFVEMRLGEVEQTLRGKQQDPACIERGNGSKQLALR